MAELAFPILNTLILGAPAAYFYAELRTLPDRK